MLLGFREEKRQESVALVVELETLLRARLGQKREVVVLVFEFVFELVFESAVVFEIALVVVLVFGVGVVVVVLVFEIAVVLALEIAVVLVLAVAPVLLVFLLVALYLWNQSSWNCRARSEKNGFLLEWFEMLPCGVDDSCSKVAALSRGVCVSLYSCRAIVFATWE